MGIVEWEITIVTGLFTDSVVKKSYFGCLGNVALVEP